MQKKINLIIIIAVFSIMAYLISIYKSQKTAYINVNELYNEFSMKKELENQIIQVQNKRKAILDSLSIQIEIKANQFTKPESVNIEDQQEFDYLKKIYFSKQQQFEEDNQQISQDYRNKITTRMNGYVKEYASNEKYDYLFGATGQGNIMYAKEENDITSEVIKYINDKYKGSN